MGLTVAIITFNEEKKLARTLQAASKIAQEIVIVDSFSTDETVSIAKSFQATVLQREFDGFSSQKNYLLDNCQQDWVLLIDADEVLTPVLCEEIQGIIKSDKASFDVYEIPFRSYCFGREVRHGGWSHFSKIRLFRNGSVRFGGEKVHERFVLKEGSSKGKTRGDLLHYTYDDMEECMEKFNRYSSSGAQDMYERGKKPSVFKLLSNPLWMFIQRYILKRGFLDGVTGLILALYVASYHYAKYAKLYQLHWQKEDR